MAKDPKHAARQKKYDDAHKAEKDERRRKWLEANPDYFREWDRKNPGRRRSIRRAHTLKQYDLTQEQYDELLISQDGHCAIPGCPTTSYKAEGGSLGVDHEHKTKRVRGLLCYRHNIMIGLAGDSIEDLEAVIAYLRRRM